MLVPREQALGPLSCGADVLPPPPPPFTSVSMELSQPSACPLGVPPLPRVSLIWLCSLPLPPPHPARQCPCLVLSFPEPPEWRMLCPAGCSRGVCSCLAGAWALAPCGGEGKEQAGGRLRGACVLAVDGGGHALCPAPLLKASGSVQFPARWRSVSS